MNQIKQGYKQTKVGIIPEDWEVKYIEDIAEVKGGKRLPLGHELTEATTPYPYIRVTNMSMGRLNDKKILYVPSEVQPKIKNYTISKDDLYIAVAGNTLGMVGTIPAKFDGANLTENADKICNIKMNKEFLLFILMSDLIQNVIQNEITTNAQPKLALTRIKKFRIPFPSIKEQEKIAEVLTTWDEAITKQTELLRAKELLKIALMQKLLSGEVRFNGFSYEWEEVRLSKIIKLQGGYAFKSEEFKKNGIPIIRISNISNNSNYMEMDDLVYYGELPNESNFLIKKNDLLIAMSGATTGKVSIYNLEKKAYLNQRVGLFKAIKPSLINYSFLTQFVFSNFFSVQLTSLLVAGAQPNISSKDIESLKIKLPSLPEQQKIAEVLSLADDEINLLKTELEELNLQKKALMQKLLTGQVRVKV